MMNSCMMMAPLGMLFVTLVFVFAVLGVIATVRFLTSRVRRGDRS